jgi:hypothetical protein
VTQGSLKKPSAEPSSQLPGHLPQSTVNEITAWLVGQPLDAVERELIRHTLEACDGDRALTASVLGISLPALRKKMTAYKVRGKPLPVPVDHANENRDTAPKPPAAAAPPEAVASATPPEPAPEIAEPVAVAPEPELVFEPSPVQWTAPEELAAAILSAATAESAEAHAVALALKESAPAEPAPAEPAPAEPAPVKRLVPAAIVMPPAPPKPARRNIPSARLIVALALAALLLALIGFGMTGTNEPAKDLVMRQHPPIEMSVKEKAIPFEQRIQVPAWVAGPPLAPAARTVASFDPALDTRMELAPPPSAALTAALKAAQGALASANIELDTRMDGPPQSAAMRAALKTAQGALASASIELDTRMDGPPPPSAAMRAALARAKGALASASIESDTRMEMPALEVTAAATEAAPGDPETTGSIPAPTFFKAPETAPMPETRLGADEHPRTAPPPVQRRAAPRAPQAQRRAAPRAPQAQAQPPDLPRQILFPFANIFNPKAQQGER